MLDDLAATLRREIVRKSMASGRRKQYNAVLSFAKHCVSLERPCLDGAFMAEISGEPHQVLVDGFIGIAFKKPWEGMPEIAKDVEPLKAKEIFEEANQGEPVELPDLYEMIGKNRAYRADEMDKYKG